MFYNRIPYAPYESRFAEDIVNQKYAHEISRYDDGEYRGDSKEDWGEISFRVASEVLHAAGESDVLIDAVASKHAQKKFVAGGRYLYAAGRPWHQTQNCLLLRADDSSEGWASLMYKATAALMSGAGIGVLYSDVREEGAPIKRKGGTSTGPLALMRMVNEAGRGIMQGGARRAAIWSGLHWNHPDILKFIHLKDWGVEVRRAKSLDFSYPANMDHTNISVILDDKFFLAYNAENHPDHKHAMTVYWDVIHQMTKTGEPGFSVDTGENSGENLRNACTEITSRDDSDICNLGSINLARIESRRDMKETVFLGTTLLMAGTLYSDVPYPQVSEVRQKNRRLGLGLMGMHEWLLKHGKPYGEDPELTKYLELYADSGRVANNIADGWGISRPIKTRGIAPTGSIAIAAETTSGIEPVFSAAMKRRFLKGKTWQYQYIIDSAVMRLINQGVDPEVIEDAYSIGPERRVAFQAYVQKYVDHAISSTINIPAWGSPTNNESTVLAFGTMLMRYLPSLRGITTYPDGSRGGQPLNPVMVKTALEHLGKEFEESGEQQTVFEQVDICDITKGGASCG